MGAWIVSIIHTMVQSRVWIIACLMCLMGSLLMAAAPGDLLFERKDGEAAQSFPPSIFQHWKHRMHYRCDACHDSLFAMELGATPITMEAMKKGENCGACHNGDTVFDVGFSNCARCHRAPSD